MGANVTQELRAGFLLEVLSQLGSLIAIRIIGAQRNRGRVTAPNCRKPGGLQLCND